MEDQLTPDEIIRLIQGQPTDRPKEEIVRDIRARHTDTKWFHPYGRKIYNGAKIEARRYENLILSAEFYFGQGSEEYNLLVQIKIVFNPAPAPALIFTRNREYPIEVLAEMENDTPKSLEDLGAGLIKGILFQRDQHLKKGV